MSNVNAIMLNVTFKQKKPNRIEQMGKRIQSNIFLLFYITHLPQCNIACVLFFVFLFSPAFPLGFVHCSLFHSLAITAVVKS